MVIAFFGMVGTSPEGQVAIVLVVVGSTNKTH